jgi:hypothetical protein
MTDQTTTDPNGDFAEGADPSDYNVGPVEAYLATADRAEVQRVLDAETAGKDREGVKNAATARLAALDADDATQDRQDDQAPAGDPSDVQSGVVGDAKDKPSMKLEDSVGSGTVNQEGAPADLVEAVEKSEELGYVAPEQNALKPSKPDYSQRNPDVMNGRA